MIILICFGPGPMIQFLGPASTNKIILGPFGPVSINHFKTIAFKYILVKPKLEVRSVARILLEEHLTHNYLSYFKKF